MPIYREKDVDKWVDDNDEQDAERLFREMLPKHIAKLNKLDKRIIEVLKEVREIFPDAEYYTSGGGFTLVLGDTHDITKHNIPPQQQRCVEWKS